MRTEKPRMVRAVFSMLLVGTILLIGTGSSKAHAASVTFDFNSLSDGSTNSAVQAYMRGVILSQLGIANAVTVTGAGIETNYTGDNHVVGPVSGSTVTSLTLGNSDNSVQHALPWDAFIYNTDSVKIDMVFTVPIYSVRFDYEIFPNGSCADPPASCSVAPDFTFKANGTTVLYSLGLDPSAAGYPGLYTHSPVSGSVNKELAPQLLATSTTYFFPGGVTHLEFYDWPERIGIDNLVVNTPEPASLTLLGAGLVGLVLARRKNS